MYHKYCRNIFLILLISIVSSRLEAHPTGNLVVVGEYVLWSYINPIDDQQHRACIMIWHPRTGVDIFLQSEYSASDFLLFNQNESLFIIERRHIEESLTFESRILKAKIGEKPVETWPWFTDKWRVGEGGFLMNTENQIVFGKYPNVYCMDKGETPVKYFESPGDVNKIRGVEENQLLLIGTATCWLTDHHGNVKREWHNLIDETVENAPLNRNQLFDAVYQNSSLLIAYWGNRSFYSIDDPGTITILLQEEDPMVPHWVGFYGKHSLLFSSKLVFTGETPKPKLVLHRSENDRTVVWEVK